MSGRSAARQADARRGLSAPGRACGRAAQADCPSAAVTMRARAARAARRRRGLRRRTSADAGPRASSSASACRERAQRQSRRARPDVDLSVPSKRAGREMLAAAARSIGRRRGRPIAVADGAPGVSTREPIAAALTRAAAPARNSDVERVGRADSSCGRGCDVPFVVLAACGSPIAGQLLVVLAPGVVLTCGRARRRRCRRARRSAARGRDGSASGRAERVGVADRRGASSRWVVAEARRQRLADGP